MIPKRRVILVEDESLAREELNYILRRNHLDVEVVGEAETPEEARFLLEKGGIDGVFLDINLETEARTKREGMDLAHGIKNLPEPPWIIFTTAYSEYALDGHKVRAAHYLLKPFNEGDVAEALSRVPLKPARLPHAIEIAHRVEDTYGVSHKVTEYVDPKAEILYICTTPNSDRLRIKLRGCRNLNGIAGPLRDWEDRLAPYGIKRIHGSYLVNWAYRGRLQPHRFQEDAYELLLREDCGCPDYLPVGKYYWQSLDI